MRLFVRLCVVGVVAASLAGCTGSPLEEGTPKNVDMSKDYTPQAALPGASVKLFREMKKAAAAAPKPPVEAPK
jgi:hypothetical protein